MYLHALAFATRNIESSSNDLDQIYIFGKFLKSALPEETLLCKEEEELLTSLGPKDENSQDPPSIPSASK